MTAPESGGAVRRALHVLLALQGCAFEGKRLKEIAEAVDANSSTVLRTLEVLEREGFAERIPGRDEFWRLSPRLVQIARAHEQELARLRQRVDEVDQRYSRNPN